MHSLILRMFSMGRLRNCVDEVLDKLTRNNESSIGEPLFQAGEYLELLAIRGRRRSNRHRKLSGPMDRLADKTLESGRLLVKRPADGVSYRPDISPICESLRPRRTAGGTGRESGKCAYV